MALDPLSLLQLLGTVAAVSAVLWAGYRKRSADAADQAQLDAAQNWRDLAESREAQLRERDAELTALTSRIGQLESRFAGLESENKVLRELGNTPAQIAIIAAELAKTTAAQQRETMDAIKALSDKILA